MWVASMKVILGFASALVVLTGVLIWTHFKDRFGGAEAETITVYCAAGLKIPVEAIAAQYEEEYGVEVRLEFGGTETLLNRLTIAKRGDLFIAADERAVESARNAKIVAESVSLCRQYPVIAVRKGNPMKITSFDDLFREEVKVAVGNPEAASIGKATQRAAGDRWAELQGAVTVMKPTVTLLATALSTKAVDAAVIWNSTVPQFKDFEAVELPAFTEQIDLVTASVMTASQDAASALKFARYLSAPEKGAKLFREHQFDALPGDEWTEKPELVLYSGGVNRPAIEKTLDEFAAREGVTVTAVYNGCGVLCSSMRAMKSTSDPRFPDAYYACDVCFVAPVVETFPEVVKLTETVIGIAVQKGNPKGVETLEDLAEGKLKLGICHTKQSTLGHMTGEMLRETKLEKAIRSNVVSEQATADLLINQLRTGSLDVAIVYEVNYRLQEDHLEFFPIDHEGARAVQPFSVRGNSKNRLLAERLLKFLQSKRSRFEESGFTWLDEQVPTKSAELEIPSWFRQPEPSSE